MKKCCQCRYVWTAVVAVVGTALAASGAGLAQAGQARYDIVIAPKASVVVQHAARELAADMHQISEANFPITSRQPDGPAIYVGAGRAMRAAFPKLALKSLPTERFFIRTSGKNMVLAGKDDQGTLYAVYTVLEDYLGVRWYSPHDTVIPRHQLLRIPALHERIPALNERKVPGFAYRDTDESPVLRHAQWDAHLRLNGVDVPDELYLGGTNRLFNGAENFYDFVLPAKYLANHPEYYSLINEKRSAYRGTDGANWAKRSQNSLGACSSNTRQES